MEEGEQSSQESREENREERKDTPRHSVGFPQVQKKKEGSGKKVVLILVILGVIGAGVWFFLSRQKGEVIDEITPTIGRPTATPSPTLAPEPIDRKEVKIQVLNGSGITGAAGSLKDKLENLGYSDIKAGNADKQDYIATNVTFNSSIDSSIRKEILDKLKEIYKEVKEDEQSLKDFDIRITIGYPKGYAPTPTQKPKATLSPTPTVKVGTTGSPTTSPTLTQTPTQTPTPTP